MQNIKETIFCVTKSFSYFNINNIEPNNFRQAKHDQPQALSQLIQLLKQLLILDLYDFKTTQIEIDQIDEQSLIIALLSIKNSPLVINYSMNFNSSRELLLTIGWLLGVCDYFKKLQLFVENVIKDLQQKVFCREDKEEQTHNFDPSLDAAEDFMRLIQLCQNSQKQLINLQKRKDSIIKQVILFQLIMPQSNKIFQEYDIRNVKPDQMLQLSNEKILNEQIQTQEQIIEHQDFLINIHKHQELFWAWMESIVEEDKKDIQNDPHYGFIDENIQITKIVNDLTKDKKIRLTVLKDLIEEFNGLILEFEGQWVRVSKLLQQCEDGQEKLKFLESQIPLVTQQQKKFYVSFENLKNSKNDWKSLREYEFNSLLKSQIQNLFPKQSIDEKDKNGIFFSYNQLEQDQFEEGKVQLEDFKLEVQKLQIKLREEVKYVEKELRELIFIPQSK